MVEKGLSCNSMRFGKLQYATACSASRSLSLCISLILISCLLSSIITTDTNTITTTAIVFISLLVVALL